MQLQTKFKFKYIDKYLKMSTGNLSKSLEASIKKGEIESYGLDLIMSFMLWNRSYERAAVCRDIKKEYFKN